MSPSNEKDVDVVVVGAGGGGLAAALAVSDAGRSVVVLEKLDRAGGNTALSTGSIPAAGSRLQREAGVEDSVDRMIADLLRQSGRHEAEGLTRRLSETSADLVDWLVDIHSVNLSLITDYKHVGHSVTRLHAPASRRGIDLANGLLDACERAGVEVLVGNPVKGLTTQDGRVTGVVVAGDRIEEYVLTCDAVILACNGFAANKALIDKWIPELSAVEYFGAHGSTGEGLEWGLGLGGYLQNASAYQGYAAVAYPHGSLLSWTTVEKGAVIVDSKGRRMGDEIIGYSGFTAEVLKGTPPTFVIYDTRIKAIVMKEEEYVDLVEMGGAKEYDTIDEMAAAIGIDSESLTKTIEDFNAAVRGEATDACGRTVFGDAPLTTPFVASRVTPGLFHTQGGLAVDEDGRVLKKDRSTIPGLFAIGGVASGISGQEGGRGYSSGNGLLSAAGLGRLAGIAASQDVDHEGEQEVAT